MKIIKLFPALVLMSLMLETNALAGQVRMHPTLLTIDVQDCGAKRNMTSSIKITTKFSDMEPSAKLRFQFKNIANGQVSTFDYGHMVTNHEIALPGGYYTFIVSHKGTYTTGAIPRSVQLLYETPISVPNISASGQCLPTVDPRSR